MDAHTLPTRILGTNHIPSDEERIIVQSLISTHQERSLALDAEVQRAEAALHSLQLEQQAQQELVEAHQALLTPMRRLIPDLLLEIFHHCHKEVRNAPMHLARVCRRWRTLALSTPTLWTVVALHGAMPTRRIVPFARACVKHSGSCNLKIVINFMNKRHDMQTVRRALFEAVDVLARHVDRWQTFEVLVNNAYKPDGGSFGFRTDAPRLEKLVLVIENIAIPLPFSSLPNLRDLRVFMLHSKDVPLLLQCTRFRKLTIGAPAGQLTLMDCWTILSNSPAMEIFDVAGMRLELDIVPKELVNLPYLRELRIGPFAPNMAPLINYLKAPALQRLCLLVGKNMDFDSTCIPRLVHECRPPLTSLSLVNTDGQDVASCLRSLPHLKSLILQSTSAPDLVILGLMEQDGEGRLHCPNLMHLGLRLCLFTGARLVELARERRDVAGGLRVLIEDSTVRNRQGHFKGLTLELNLVGEFSDDELGELRGLQTASTVRPVRARRVYRDL